MTIKANRVEKYVYETGLEMIHRRAALWIYFFYFVWNTISLVNHISRHGAISLTFVFTDTIDMLLLLTTAIFACQRKMSMERVSVLMLAVNAFCQQGLRTLHNVTEGQPLQIEILLGGLVFTSLFLIRAVSLTYRIVEERFLILKGLL